MATPSPSRQHLSPTSDQRSAYKNYSKAGVLYKTRDYLAGRRPRLFVLDSQLLHYYINPDDPAPKHTIFLLGCEVKCLEKEEGDSGRFFFPFEVSHVKSAKAWKLAATTEVGREEWVEKLKEASKLSVKTPEAEGGENDVVNGVGEGAGQAKADNSYMLDTPDRDRGDNGDGGHGNGYGNDAHFDDTNLPDHLKNVPLKYHENVDKAVDTILDLVNSDGWQPLFEKKGIVARTKPGKLVTVRGDGVMKHHPKLVFKTLTNIKEKEKYDNQLEVGRVVQSFNDYTGCDYLHFKPVWPTSTRDFCNVGTWKVVEGKGGKKCIVISAFEGYEVPKVKGFVRGSCVIAGWIIRPIVDEASGELHSKVTIVVSTDLKGNLPTSIVNQVTSQQALFPVIISKYLKEGGGSAGWDSLGGGVEDITDETLIRDVIRKREEVTEGTAQAAETAELTPTPAPASSPSRKKIAFASDTAPTTPKIQSESKKSGFTATTTSPPINKTGTKATTKRGGNHFDGVVVPTAPALSNKKPSLLWSMLALYLPVILWGIAKFAVPSVLLQSRGILFFLGLMIGLRLFARRRLGVPMSYVDGSAVGVAGNGNGGTGAVHTNFTVDLKRVLKFIEENRKMEVAVTHIAMRAAAQVLDEMPAFNGRRVTLPLLGIRGFFPNATIDVSTALGKHTNGTSGIVKVCNANCLSVVDISKKVVEMVGLRKVGRKFADALLPNFLRAPLTVLSEQLDLPVTGLGLVGRTFGSALVYCSPNNGKSEMEISVSPATFQSAANVVVVVGGVKVLQTYSKESRAAIARPVLQISVTIDVPVANVNSCRRFCERLQQLIRQPELLN